MVISKVALPILWLAAGRVVKTGTDLAHDPPIVNEV